jgi:hypothetical protein
MHFILNAEMLRWNERRGFFSLENIKLEIKLKNSGEGILCHRAELWQPYREALKRNNNPSHGVYTFNNPTSTTAGLYLTGSRILRIS